MAGEKRIKLKKCKIRNQDGLICGEMYEPDPRRPFIAWCSPECGRNKWLNDLAKVAKRNERKAAIERREAKEKLKTRREWLVDAQVACNKYIRLRDKKDGCISCDKPASWNGQWHASHYYATSIRPNLRFDEKNIHKACSVCNNYMHGNLTPYRERLVLKIGTIELERLDNDRSVKKYSIQDLKEIKARYVELTKRLDLQD